MAKKQSQGFAVKSDSSILPEKDLENITGGSHADTSTKPLHVRDIGSQTSLYPGYINKNGVRFVGP
jgi:hypothetical protein